MIFLSIILFAAVAPVALGDSISIYECQGNSKLHIQNLTMWPLPIQFPSVLHSDLMGTISGEVDGDVVVEVKLYGKISFGLLGSTWLKIPCIEGFGSCTIRDGCSVLAESCDSDRCRCPIAEGEFRLKFRDMEIPRLPRILEWAARRDYKMKVESYQDGWIIQCHEVYIYIDDD